MCLKLVFPYKLPSMYLSNLALVLLKMVPYLGAALLTWF